MSRHSTTPVRRNTRLETFVLLATALALAGPGCRFSSAGGSGIRGADRPPGGSVAALEPLLTTPRATYYALTYWSDGLRVKGYLGLPRSARRVPGIVLNRGGNREFGALRGPEIVPFVEAGYATVATQYRGNAGGEGREEFGGADVRDVLNAVKVLQAQQAVDPERIGMVGFSRGGMMTYLALRADGARSRPAVRAAAVVGGVSDLDALVKTRPDMLEVCVELIGAGPVADPEAYAARSVVRWPEAIRAPILILHGELDARVPVEQARWAADRLAAAGKDVTLETFAGGDHALSKHGWGFPALLAWMERRLGSPGEDLGFVSHREAIEAAWAAWPP